MDGSRQQALSEWKLREPKGRSAYGAAQLPPSAR